MENRKKVLNLLGLAMRAGKIISGSETVIEDLKKKKIKIVFLASDLQNNTLEKVNRAANKANVPTNDLFSSQELAQAIGKKRKVIAVADTGFYKAFKKLIDEGV